MLQLREINGLVDARTLVAKDPVVQSEIESFKLNSMNKFAGWVFLLTGLRWLWLGVTIALKFENSFPEFVGQSTALVIALVWLIFA